jgi:hypothetical protein
VGLANEPLFTLANGGSQGSLMTAGGTAWIMDNVTFDAPIATSVPEPASLLLMGSGMVGLIARRRRSRADGTAKADS